MPLTLQVDGPRWRAHLRGLKETHPDLVPVIKGNGYGLGLERLARESGELGVDTVAVGTYAEVGRVLEHVAGADVLVLSPWRPSEPDVVYAPHVIHTVGRLIDLQALAERDDRPRVVLERLTSMRRHGLSARDLREAASTTQPGRPGVRLEGIAVHLPFTRGSHQPEMDRLMTDVVAAGLDTRRVFASHLRDSELALLRVTYPDHEFRPRIGTDLWLGDREALRVTATVLDVHPVERGDVFGYRGRTAPAAGSILVVAGGTAHGIGLESPTSGATLKDRAATIARGGLDAAGFVRSPYTIDGKPRLFAEPPHMQVSMLFLPAGVAVPAVGDEVPVRVRFTATTFDRTVVTES